MWCLKVQLGRNNKKKLPSLFVPSGTWSSHPSNSRIIPPPKKKNKLHKLVGHGHPNLETTCASIVYSKKVWGNHESFHHFPPRCWKHFSLSNLICSPSQKKRGSHVQRCLDFRKSSPPKLGSLNPEKALFPPSTGSYISQMIWIPNNSLSQWTVKKKV